MLLGDNFIVEGTNLYSPAMLKETILAISRVTILRKDYRSEDLT